MHIVADMLRLRHRLAQGRSPRRIGSMPVHVTIIVSNFLLWQNPDSCQGSSFRLAKSTDMGRRSFRTSTAALVANGVRTSTIRSSRPALNSSNRIPMTTPEQKSPGLRCCAAARRRPHPTSLVQQSFNWKNAINRGVRQEFGATVTSRRAAPCRLIRIETSTGGGGEGREFGLERKRSQTQTYMPLISPLLEKP